jgi:hypothetical protein
MIKTNKPAPKPALTRATAVEMLRVGKVWRIYATNAHGERLGTEHREGLKADAEKVRDRMLLEYGLQPEPVSAAPEPYTVSAAVWAESGGPDGPYGDVFRAGRLTVIPESDQ